MLLRDIENELPPEYHDNLLIVRFQPDLGHAAAAAMAGMASTMVSSGVGVVLDAASASAAAIAPSLLSLDKLGWIRRIVPFVRALPQGSLDVGTAVLSSFVTANDTGNLGSALLSGSAIVELEPGVDPDDAARRVGSDAQVQFVSRVPIRYMEVAKKTPVKKTPGAGKAAAAAAPGASSLWNLTKINWAQARNRVGFAEATGVKVAVLDTGVDDAHQDLDVTQYVFDHPDTPQLSARKDIAGHGTHVAGTIAATIGNAVGVNGICRCQLLCWKIFNDQPKYIASYNRFIYVVDPIMYQRALADCLDQDIDVINLSIGGTKPPDAQEKQLINALLSKGTTIVAAMGNHRSLGSPTSYPAAIPDVVAVGATSIDDSVATFSNRGDHITIAAPGVGIWSTMPTYEGQSGFHAVSGTGAPKEGKAIKREVNYASLDGTSMATPHVTGAVALLFAKEGRLTPGQTAERLKGTADPVAGMNNHAFHPDFGSGRLNLERLL